MMKTEVVIGETVIMNKTTESKLEEIEGELLRKSVVTLLFITTTSEVSNQKLIASKKF